MNRTLLLVASSVWSLLVVCPCLAETLEPSPVVHPDNKEEMARECDQHLEQLKDAGAPLPDDKKAEFDYNLEIAAIEAKALKDANHKDPKRHAKSCQSRLNEARHIVKKHADQVAREKRKEERKARDEERKKKAEARRAEREAAKTKREAERAEKMAHPHHDKNTETSDGFDHGKSEGASKEEPGTEAAKPMM